MAKASAAVIPEQRVIPFSTKMLSLSEIVGNSAQTRGMGVLSNLQQMGYGFFEKVSTEKDPIVDMLRSDEAEVVAQALNLLEEYEPEIVEFAKQLRKAGQLQAIGVVEESKDEYDIVYGARRFISLLYNSVKYNDAVDEIEAKVYEEKPSDLELKQMADDENRRRKNESPMDMAKKYKEYVTSLKLKPKEIGKLLNYSDQHVSQHLLLLDNLLKDKWQKIHSRDLSVDAALKLLARRRSGDNGEDTKPSNGKQRFRFPSPKSAIKIYEAGRKPSKMSDEEWECWKDSGARKLVAQLLGLKFTEFVPAKEEEEKKEEGGKTIQVKRNRAQTLLVALGKTSARTWNDKELKEKLENIVNIVEEGQEVEGKSLQKLLKRLMDQYKEGLTVEIVDSPKKEETEEAEEIEEAAV